MCSPGFIDFVVSLTTPNSAAVSQSVGEPQSVAAFGSKRQSRRLEACGSLPISDNALFV